VISPPRPRLSARLPDPLAFARIVLLCSAVSAFGLIASSSHAQPSDPADSTADSTAPVVDVEVITGTIVDTVQTFAVLATDDRAIAGVTLYHRREGEQAFTGVPMRPVGADGRYGISLPTDATDRRTIEYYVQALDESGNRTVSGFAFDPLRRELRSSPAAIAARPPLEESSSPESSSNRPRWWAVVLGLVAVGAIVSLTGDEGGGGGDDTGTTVPLTIDLPEPVIR